MKLLKLDLETIIRMPYRNMNIYQDESGCLGFKRGSSKYFVVALLCIEKSKHISNVIRKFKGKIIKAGWPKHIEIKANHLFYAPHNNQIPPTYQYKLNPSKPIKLILQAMLNCEIEIDAIVIKKDRINEDLRKIPPSILLNYFAGKVLIDRITRYDDVNLYVDRTSKETHDAQHFDGYIKTNAYLTRKGFFPLNIEHADSNVVRGVSAVDFLSWSIFRKYEYNDDQFFDIVKPRISVLKTFFFRGK